MANIMMLLLCPASLLLLSAMTATADFPTPFYRDLTVQSPPQSGNDVVLIQNFLSRAKVACASTLPLTGKYDVATGDCIADYKVTQGLAKTDKFYYDVATLLMQQLSQDGYKDNNTAPELLGYKYKVHLQVHRNRSIESVGRLIAANGTQIYEFAARAHGYGYGSHSWPNFDDSDCGVNQFTSDGNTPTGLIEFDLNSPEDEPKIYGPYPVNRAVQGIEGNAKFLIPMIRDGILLHTGDWEHGWTPGKPMPNSEGCIHAYPDSIKTISDMLQAEGVTVHPNTGGKLPYPYKPQGLLSIELVDGDSSACRL